MGRRGQLLDFTDSQVISIVRHGKLQWFGQQQGGYKKSRLAFRWRLFREFRLFSVRTSVPFLHQRLWKSVKVKEEKLESGTHGNHPTTPLVALPRIFLTRLRKNASSSWVEIDQIRAAGMPVACSRKEIRPHLEVSAYGNLPEVRMHAAIHLRSNNHSVYDFFLNNSFAN